MNTQNQQTQANLELPTVTHEEAAKLVAEIERLNRYIREYGANVSQKLDVIEEDMLRLEAENQRLLMVKDSLSVERDACVALTAQLALATGMKAGTAPGNTVVVELPSGQVSWQFEETEAHLFERLPQYAGNIESLDITEKYSRVMNPGVETSN